MKPKKRPIRTCVACRSTSDKKELIRIVRNAAGEIAVDPTGKKEGRGAYVCRTLQCVTEAFKKKKLDRALRTSVSDELVKVIEQYVQENENAG